MPTGMGLMDSESVMGLLILLIVSFFCGSIHFHHPIALLNYTNGFVIL